MKYEPPPVVYSKSAQQQNEKLGQNNKRKYETHRRGFGVEYYIYGKYETETATECYRMLRAKVYTKTGDTDIQPAQSHDSHQPLTQS